MLFRLVLLLAIAGALVIFTWSNLQPLALTFLGIQTPAFPLALWVLMAIAAGIVTTLAVGVLFSLSSYATMREARAQFRQAAQRSGFGEFSREGFQTKSPFSPGTKQTSSRSTGSKAAQSAAADDSAWRDWEGYEQSGDRKQTSKSPATSNEDDDWNLDSSGDWEEESPNPVDRHKADQTSSKRDAQQPKSSSRSDSTYSYGTKDPGTTGVGKQEKVVDAEYRVIIPPYTPSAYTPPPPPPPPPSKPTPEAENADDWFEDG